MDDEDLDIKSFKMIGIVKAKEIHEKDKLDFFSYSIEKWREDNSWDKDSLVKILGYRVELYEIEKRLRNINYITNSYVFVKEHNKYKKIICACVETNKTSKVHIMKQLKINLPSYMIPKEIKLIKKFPLNKSFKIDRQILKKKFSG